MVDVQFDENQYPAPERRFTSRAVLGEPATPGMVRWLMKFGVKDERTAGYVLMTLAAIIFAVSVYIFSKQFRGPAGGRFPCRRPRRLTRSLDSVVFSPPGANFYEVSSPNGIQTRRARFHSDRAFGCRFNHLFHLLRHACQSK